MIRRGENVEAHQVRSPIRSLSKLLDEHTAPRQWDSATSSWQKIGDVVDAVGSGRKQLYEGREYDYVFDVDVQEGAPPLKLPYNVSGTWTSLAKWSPIAAYIYKPSREPIHCCPAIPPEQRPAAELPG